jgi:hypothetical protein
VIFLPTWSLDDAERVANSIGSSTSTTTSIKSDRTIGEGTVVIGQDDVVRVMFANRPGTEDMEYVVRTADRDIERLQRDWNRGAYVTPWGRYMLTHHNYVSAYVV